MGCVSFFPFRHFDWQFFFPLLSYGPTAVNEMLNTACSLRGLALVHKFSGERQVYREAIKMFEASVRCLIFSCGKILVRKRLNLTKPHFPSSHVCSFAEKVQNPDILFTAIKRYWNACLPLTRSPEERGCLHESFKKLLMVGVLVCIISQCFRYNVLKLPQQRKNYYVYSGWSVFTCQ